MPKLPDLEGLAIFAKVVEARSFSGAAEQLGLSKATVSKAVTRVEARLGARLFNRTSRRLALTDAGRQLAARAAQLLAAADEAEREAMSQSASPRGLVRLAAPMSFGLSQLAPLLPDFCAAYPDITLDLHLSDAMVDLIGDGFDAALRIAAMPDSSLLARRLCAVSLLVVAAPAYLKRRGRPSHPLHLADHACLGYSYAPTPDSWRFTNAAGEVASVRAVGPLRINNGDAMIPALVAGLGISVLPDFIVSDAVKAGRLEVILTDWHLPPSGLNFVTPPGGPRPARVEALAGFLTKRLSRPSWRNGQ